VTYSGQHSTVWERDMAVRLEVEVLDSAGAPLFQVQHDDVRYVVARPGPYTVRVRHFGPQKMDMEMCVDGKNCGEAWVRSRVCRLLGLGVFALRADNEEHWGTGNKLVKVGHVLRVQRRLDSRQGDGTSTVRFPPLG
jgi:hypothetical protein